MELTTPKSILIGSIIIAFAILFRIDENVPLLMEANAEVDGMDSYDLRNDYDFRNAVWTLMDEYHYDFELAVKNVVEDCEVTGYLYSSDISC